MTVRTHFDGDVAHLHLDRGERGNALDAQMVEDLIRALSAITVTPSRLLVLTGEGKGFCGGFDLEGLDTQSDGDLALRFLRIEVLLQALHAMPMPTLALAHGYAWGAGADLFAACCIRIAAPGTRFSFPGARFGIALGTGRLAAIVGTDRASEIVLGGTPLDAESALEAGLATRILGQEDWKLHLSDLRSAQAPADGETAAMLLPLLRQQDHALDMAALARSVSRPGLKARMQNYVEQITAARQART